VPFLAAANHPSQAAAAIERTFLSTLKKNILRLLRLQPITLLKQLLL
jgi:hypothetical protein